MGAALLFILPSVALAADPGASADLVLHAVTPRTVESGSSFDVTMQVTNNGPDAATGARFTQRMSHGLVHADSRDHTVTEIFAVAADDERLRRVTMPTGELRASVAMTMTDETVVGAHGISIRPGTSDVFVALKLAGQATSELAIVDRYLGSATPVGDTGLHLAALAFGPTPAARGHSAPLYGLTGDHDPTCASCIYRIDPSTAAATLMVELNTPDAGEALAFNPQTGVLYHASGGLDQDPLVFEGVNPARGTRLAFDTDAVVREASQATALAWGGGAGMTMALADGGLYRVEPASARQALPLAIEHLFDLDFVVSGMTHSGVGGPPPPVPQQVPCAMEWGVRRPTLTCDVGTVEPGETTQWTITFQAEPDASRLTSRMVVRSDLDDPNPRDNRAGMRIGVTGPVPN